MSYAHSTEASSVRMTYMSTSPLSLSTAVTSPLGPRQRICLIASGSSWGNEQLRTVVDPSSTRTCATPIGPVVRLSKVAVIKYAYLLFLSRRRTMNTKNKRKSFRLHPLGAIK